MNTQTPLPEITSDLTSDVASDVASNTTSATGNGMDEGLAVKALAALAQTSRLRVFRAIVGAGPQGLQPGQLSQALDMPANTLSFHLKELHHAGLVGVQREGRFLRYRANMDAMQSLVVFLTAHCCQGEPCSDMPVVACASANC